MASNLVKYVCTRHVHAKPATYGEYLEETGKTAVPKINKTSPGFMAVYDLGTSAERHTWFAAAEFNDAYKQAAVSGILSMG